MNDKVAWVETRHLSFLVAPLAKIITWSTRDLGRLRVLKASPIPIREADEFYISCGYASHKSVKLENLSSKSRPNVA